MADVLVGSGDLKIELQRAKESLKDVDENIKKLTGRDPLEKRNHPRRVSLGTPVDLRGRGSFGSPTDRPERRTRALSGPGERGSSDIRGRLFALARQGIDEPEGPPAKRRIVGRFAGGAFSRLGPSRQEPMPDSDEEDVPVTRTLQSSIVPVPGVARTRKESIDQQNKDEKGKARNRRMFGALLGTLQKFRTEAKETKDRDDQRRRIEVKLEDQAKQEKDDALKERQMLFKERRERQVQVQLLEQKMELVNNHEVWETETAKLKSFLRTKAKPHIFYLPRSLDPTDSRVKHTHKAINELIKSRKKKLEEDLEELANQINKPDGEKGVEEEVTKEKERSGKRVENKENLKRKSERKRVVISHDDPEEEELEEEEDGVSVGVVRSGEQGEGEEVRDRGDRGSDDSEEEMSETPRKNGVQADRDRETTPKSANEKSDNEDVDDKHRPDNKGRAPREQTNKDSRESEDTDEPPRSDHSRRVVMAEDEEDNSMDQSGLADPEQADE